MVDQTTSVVPFADIINFSPSMDKDDFHYKMWDGITHLFLNFNRATVEVLGWISNFIPHITGYMITYPR